MCSIIGYYGKSSAAPILVKSLKRMEYRGYDSVGVATKHDTIQLKKGTGKVNEVNSKFNLDALPGNIGIGHTRWATHGKVTNTNAHPHASNSKKIALVHNGTITNFEQLRDELIQEGYTFESDTDTEVIVNLLQKNYTGDIKSAIIDTVSRLEGEYAFVAMFEDGNLAAARLHAPLVVGVAKDSIFLSSDVLGFIEYTDEAIYIENRNFVILENDNIEILDFDGSKAGFTTTKISKEFGDAYKGDYAHFTLKEIYEQPETIVRAASQDAINLTLLQYIRDVKNIHITGSGSSYNSALVAKQILGKYAKLRVETTMSSELQFSAETIEPDSTLIAISQSGESADVLQAVRLAKSNRCKIISIVNVRTSSLARESDIVIPMNCGPEIGVAATKSFTSQLMILYTIAQELSEYNFSPKQISQDIAKILDAPDIIKEIASHLKDISDIYVLGRGVHYPIAVEVALKLKEITYIHAEGIPGGELKHGPLALMDENVFVIIINPNDTTYNDTITSTREIKARGAKIIGLSDVYNEMYDYWIEIPKSEYPICEIVPMQLLAYYAALEKDTDPDYPRNLAKSVTVK